SVREMADAGVAADIAAMLRRELGLDDDIDTDALVYDADRAPEPRVWQAADEGTRLLAIRRHHATLAKHPELPNPGLHHPMHDVLENQLAAGVPAETAATIARLVAEGANRHEAVHAVASVVVGEVHAMVRDGRTFDHAKAARALAALRGRD